MTESEKVTIGNCELYLGDCMEVMPMLSKVNLILTDIPYGEVSKNGEDRAKYSGQLRNMDKEFADIISFDLVDFLKLNRKLCDGSMYCFRGIEQIKIIYDFFSNEKDFMVRQCAWRKTNPPPTNGQHLWLSSFENCIFAKKRKTKFNQICKSSVWDFPIGSSKQHPTEKPLKLFKYLVEGYRDWETDRKSVV